MLFRQRSAASERSSISASRSAICWWRSVIQMCHSSRGRMLIEMDKSVRSEATI
jgi:hypothetical protein